MGKGTQTAKLLQQIRTRHNRADLKDGDRDTLRKVQTERDAEIARVVRLTERLGTEMLRADRAERILAALREPSQAVCDAAFESFYGMDKPKSLDEAIRAAVAAAEQEVDRA